MFDNTLNCWKNFKVYLPCQPFSPISAFFFIETQKYLWYTDIVKFYLVVRQPKN
jgi:hypothetical protein